MEQELKTNKMKKHKILVIILIFLSSPAYADVVDQHTVDYNCLDCWPGAGIQIYPQAEPHDYYLLTQSYGGTVSLIKDLTEKECYHLEKTMRPVFYEGLHPVDNDDIEFTECFK